MGFQNLGLRTFVGFVLYACCSILKVESCICIENHLRDGNEPVQTLLMLRTIIIIMSMDYTGCFERYIINAKRTFEYNNNNNNKIIYSRLYCS